MGLYFINLFVKKPQHMPTYAKKTVPLQPEKNERKTLEIKTRL